jgi:hypothetical protein
LKTTERFRRADFGHMEMQVTIEIPFNLQPDSELIEDICENNRDSVEIPAK